MDLASAYALHQPAKSSRRPDAPKPVALDKATRGVDPFRRSHLGAWGVEPGDRIEEDGGHPLLLVEHDLLEHGEAAPDLFTEERTILGRRRP